MVSAARACALMRWLCHLEIRIIYRQRNHQADHECDHRTQPGGNHTSDYQERECPLIQNLFERLKAFSL